MWRFQSKLIKVYASFMGLFFLKKKSVMHVLREHVNYAVTLFLKTWLC
jgi:hypothetical protein